MDATDKTTEPVALFEGPTLQLFRGYRFIALVTVAVGAGAVGMLGVQLLQQRAVDAIHVVIEHVAPPASTQLRWPLTLPSASGEAVTVTGPAVINVWLQGCADCMPAFEANKQLIQQGGYGSDVVVYNIAYGRADPSWATSYLVDTNLLFDEGSAVVQPLGIGTFTTLVVGASGAVTVIGAPTAPNHKARVLAAWQAATPAPSAVVDDARSREALALLRGQARSYAAQVTANTPATCVFQVSAAADGVVSVSSNTPHCQWSLAVSSLQTTSTATASFSISISC